MHYASDAVLAIFEAMVDALSAQKKTPPRTFPGGACTSVSGCQTIPGSAERDGSRRSTPADPVLGGATTRRGRASAPIAPVDAHLAAMEVERPECAGTLR